MMIIIINKEVSGNYYKKNEKKGLNYKFKRYKINIKRDVAFNKRKSMGCNTI